MHKHMTRIFNMRKSLWEILDLTMHAMHLSLILLLLIGWSIADTRFLHFLLVWLIFGSWFGLGLVYGFGYCLITDLHWKIKEKLGEHPKSQYYVKYMVEKVTTRDFSEVVVNRVTSYIYYGNFVIANFLFFSSF